MHGRWRSGAALAVALCSSSGLGAGCGDEGDFDGEPLEVAGAFANSFSEELVITTKRWGPYDVLEYDNFTNRVVFRTRPLDGSEPVFGRIVYTEPERRGSFFYCFEVTSTSSLEVARTAQVEVDASNPWEEGCGDFPWARAWAAVSIRGLWTIEGAMHTITATVWQRPDVTLEIVAWDNERRYGVAALPEDSAGDPATNRYRLIEWTPAPETEAGPSWFVCDTRENLATANAAITSSVAADRSDPATGGCRAGPWDRLTIREPD